jgi:hypothetical protein
MTKTKVHGNKIEIDYAVLDALMQFKLTKAFVSDYFNISEDTLEKRIKEHSGLTYGDYGRLKQQGVALKLQQRCIELALKGDRTLMIFALKNMANWADKQETTHTIGNEPKRLTIDMNDNDDVIEAEAVVVDE